MDANFFISRCQHEISSENELVLYAQDKLHALGLRRCWQQVAQWGKEKSQEMEQEFETVVVRWNGDGGSPHEIPVRYAQSQEVGEEGSKKSAIIELKNSGSIIQTSQIELLEFAAEEEANGNIVILTWHTRSKHPNRCFFTSDNLDTKRAGGEDWTPSKFHNYDYQKSWRGADPEMKKFNSLCNHLEQGELVNDFEYELVRPSDNALVRYWTRYILFTNKFGEQIRAGISKPAAYDVLREVPVL